MQTHEKPSAQQSATRRILQFSAKFNVIFAVADWQISILPVRFQKFKIQFLIVRDINIYF